MKNKILKSLVRRTEEEISVRNQIKYLKEINWDDHIDQIIETVYLYTRPKKGLKKLAIFVAEVIGALGHGLRNRIRKPKDSALAARTGAFILYTFEELGMLQVVKGASANGHNQYIVQVLDDDAISALWNDLNTTTSGKLPSETPYVPWTGIKHETGQMMVKTQSRDVLSAINPVDHPIVFDCINKAQAVGWNVNKDVYEVYKWALRNKTDAFAEIWELASRDAKTTKIREANAIGDIAKKFLGKTFYHLYYYDFRGRKYPTTAYLHEQGSDLARGLLIRADRSCIGEMGYKWLLISIASNWAGDAGRSDKAKTDKIPLADRVQWSSDNEDILLSYAENPKVHQGWMKADKPWQFLAACMELLKLRTWQSANGNFDDYSYPSGLECYVDGSNNGSQHLSALTKDEVTAPHVNLVPSELPGDLYAYVAGHVWNTIESTVGSFTPDELAWCSRYVDTLIDIKKQIMATEPRSEIREELVVRLKAYKAENAGIADKAATYFWTKISDLKQRRKVVKRNVMTLPYGGTSYGLGEQQITDAKKHGIDLLYQMEHKWGAYMGREVYENCKVSLERPMQLLDVFEQAGRRAELKGKFLSWKVPITGFPVVQNYTEGIVKKKWILYGPPTIKDEGTGHYVNELQLAICHIEDTVPSRGKQAQGASPNCIHSLDAAHLMLTVHRANFPITTIHDSYGCLLADMDNLYRIVRETFVELYKADPLSSIIADIDGDLSTVEFGNLDINLILQSEYCFA